MGAVIGDACHHDTFAPMLQHDMLVEQHVQAQPAELIDPRMSSGVVLVVPRHEKSAVAGVHPLQRARVGGQILDTAVDDVAGDGDDIGLQRVDGLHNGLDIRAFDGRSDMQIAHLHDGESAQRLGQRGDRHVDAPDSRPPARIEQPDGARQDGKKGHGDSASGKYRCRRPGRQHGSRQQRHHRHPEVTQKGEHEQGGEGTGRQQAGEGETVRQRLPAHPAGSKAERQQDGGSDDHGEHGRRGRLAPWHRRYQAQRDVRVQQNVEDQETNRH